MIAQCCVCHRVRIAGHWVEETAQPEEHPALYTHGFCPHCLHIQMRDLDAAMGIAGTPRPSSSRNAAGAPGRAAAVSGESV